MRSILNFGSWILDFGDRVFRTLAHFRSKRALVAGLLIVGGCAKREAKFEVLPAAAAETKEWKFGSQAGKQIETDHYDIYTTTRDDALAQALPQVIESANAYYRFTAPSEKESPERMRIYLFSAREQFEHFTRRFAGARAETLNKVRNGGYTENGVCVVEFVANQITFPILAHEGMHQYLHFCAAGRVPAWLNEGLAVQCEGQRWGKVGVREFDPKYNPPRRRELADALDHGEVFTLRELLQIDAGHVIGTNSRKIGGYYGQLWLLLQFLQEYDKGKYKAGYERLLHTLGTQDLEPFAQAAFVTAKEGEFNLGECVFRAFITNDLDTADREFRTYVQSRLLSKS